MKELEAGSGFAFETVNQLMECIHLSQSLAARLHHEVHADVYDRVNTLCGLLHQVRYETERIQEMLN